MRPKKPHWKPGLPDKLLRMFARIRQSGVRKSHIILADSVRRFVGRTLIFDQVIYRLDRDAYASGRPVVQPNGFSSRRFSNWAEIPHWIWTSLEPEEDDRLRETFLREFNRGSNLWIGFIDEKFAAYQWSIGARLLNAWYVDLRPDDLVIYSAETLNAYRGLGINAVMFRQAIEQEPNEIDIYCDAAKWNRAAHKNIEKAGFRSIKIVRIY